MLTTLALVGMGVSLPKMFQRLHDRATPPMPLFDPPIERTSFEVLGDPVSIETLDVEQDGPPMTRIRISWKGLEEEVEFQQEEDNRLPGLLRYGDWLRVVPMVITPPGEVGDKARLQQLIDEGRAKRELLIAVRQLPEGFDPESWGSVRRKDWNYRFIVFSVDEAGHPVSRTYERNYGELQDLAEAMFLSLDFERGSALKGGPERIAAELDKVRKAHGQRSGDEALWTEVDGVLAGSADGAAAVGELRELLEERFWQYQAMLIVTPKLQHPRTKVVDYGISAMGWTWPLAGASALSLTIGVLMVMASWVRRDDDLLMVG
ncbi:MAG: hypothetical protein KDB26_12870 [Microthrixaceae bacterium]|nr:hypothetical protein [Microthrixaceae bacterium]